MLQISTVVLAQIKAVYRSYIFWIEQKKLVKKYIIIHWVQYRYHTLECLIEGGLE